MHWHAAKTDIDLSKGLGKPLSQKQATLSLVTYSTVIRPSMKEYGEIMESTKPQMDERM